MTVFIRTMAFLLIALFCILPTISFADMKTLPKQKPSLSQGYKKKPVIDAKFSNIEISTLLRLIAKMGNKSIVIDGEINHKISINFTKTPYDTALEAVLNVANLQMTEKNNLIVVQTKEDSRITESFIVKNIDIKDIEKTLVKLFGDRANIQFSRNLNMVLITASPDVIRVFSRMLKRLDVARKQVMIEAAFVEVALDDNTSTGINLGALLNKFDSAMSLVTEGFALDPAAQSSPSGFYGSTEVYVGKSNRSINAMIEALQTVTDLKVLTHPKVISLNDQEAELIVGKKLGFRVTTTTQTVTQESVKFLKVGTQLKFKPHITENNDVIMTIHPEVSDGSISKDGLPNETTTEITTQVRVADGQTFVLGGLIRERNQDVVQKVPLLGSIPYLGVLFRRTINTTTRSEILVFITPTIITNSNTSEDTKNDIRRLKKITASPVKKSEKRMTKKPESVLNTSELIWLWDE